MPNEIFVCKLETYSKPPMNKDYKTHMASLYVVDLEKSLKNNTLHFKIKMKPGYMVSTHKLHDDFKINYPPMTEYLYNQCKLNKLAFPYKTYRSNQNKLKNLTKKDIVKQRELFFKLSETLQTFSTLTSHAKTLTDHDLSCSSAMYLDQSGNMLVSQSPKIFPKQFKVEFYFNLGIVDILIKAPIAPNHTEKLEKIALTTKQVTSKFMGFIPEIYGYFKPITYDIPTGSYKFIFEISTNK